jgi:hypothetical protein
LRFLTCHSDFRALPLGFFYVTPKTCQRQLR